MRIQRLTSRRVSFKTFLVSLVISILLGNIGIYYYVFSNMALAFSPSDVPYSSQPAQGRISAASYVFTTNGVMTTARNVETGESISSANATFVVQSVIAQLEKRHGTLAFHGIFLFDGQITIPVGMQINLVGVGPAGSILEYIGSKQQPFIRYLGNNQGSTIEKIGIRGYYADPAVSIENLGYQSLISIIDAEIGDVYHYADENHRSLGGVRVRSDVFNMIGGAVWGRDYGVRFMKYTTEARIYGTAIAALSASPVKNNVAIWADDTAPANVFEGSLYLTNVIFASTHGDGVRGRSILVMQGCYVETARLPVHVKNARVTITGNTFKTDNTAAKYLILAEGSNGIIADNYLETPIMPNGIINLIKATSSSLPNGWSIRQDYTMISGNLKRINQFYDIDEVGIFEGVKYRNSGVSTLANNGYIAHGLQSTPTVAIVSPQISTMNGVPIVAAITSRNATHIQVGLYWTNGTALSSDVTVDWYAEYKP